MGQRIPASTFELRDARPMIKVVGVMLAAALLLGTAVSGHCGETATANDTARFLAGLPPSPGSPLAALTKSALWQRHARHFDALFARKDDSSLRNIRGFSKREITHKDEALLYMFSGPDFLYATSFFPDAPTYVLSGLEPTGDIPNLQGLKPEAIDHTLQNLERSLRSLLSFSFFQTNDMRSELNKGPVFGTLPLLYVFMARSGKTILEATPIALDHNGNVGTPETGDAEGRISRASGSSVQGVKILFSDKRHAQQTLYYFSTDVSNEAPSRRGFLQFCYRLGAAVSFIKSASYLLHRDRFSEVRSFLLERSSLILQDDSGIPVAYFKSTEWRLQPFGNYIGPIPLFKQRYQASLARLFQKTHHAALDFGVGYRWHNSQSNLLIAVKQTN